MGGIASSGKMLARNEFKLLDVPEMGYLTSDQPPRGELCVKTPTMISGYYKNEQEMKDKFIDGYFCTGDIVVLEGNDNVRIIDRKKNLFKLAQGEFVSPERLEVRKEQPNTYIHVHVHVHVYMYVCHWLYMSFMLCVFIQLYVFRVVLNCHCFVFATQTLYTVGSSKINQMYIYGNSLQSNIVAVVVPHSDGLQKWWAEHNPEGVLCFMEYCTCTCMFSITPSRIVDGAY